MTKQSRRTIAVTSKGMNGSTNQSVIPDTNGMIAALFRKVCEFKRRPPCEWLLESGTTCARRDELLALGHHLSLAEIHAHRRQVNAATQVSSPVAFSMEPWFGLPTVLPFSGCAINEGPGVFNVRGGTSATWIITT